MDNNKNRFKKRYIKFLKSSNERGLDDAILESEAEKAAALIDCDAYIEAQDSEWCQLCADDSDVMHASGYALTDVGHTMEQNRKTAIAGLKNGIILPIAVPVCERCRARHRIIQYLPTFSCIAVVVLALILTNLPSVRQKLYEANLFVPVTMRPFFLFAVITAVAVIINAALRRYLIESFSGKTVFSPLKIKRLHSLAENGWKKLYKNRQFKFMFEKNRPAYTYDDECDCHECHSEPQADMTEESQSTTEVKADEPPSDE